MKAMENSDMLYEFPILDIAGTEYEINIGSYYWFPADHNSLVKELELSSLEVMRYDDYSHYGYYDLKRKKLVKSFPKGITEFPKDVVAISFPRLRDLDPRRFALMNGLPVPPGQKSERKFVAKLIPLDETDLACRIDENRAMLKDKSIQRQLRQPATQGEKTGLKKKQRLRKGNRPG
jgi:hypothetical protein